MISRARSVSRRAGSVSGSKFGREELTVACQNAKEPPLGIFQASGFACALLRRRLSGSESQRRFLAETPDAAVCTFSELGIGSIM